MKAAWVSFVLVAWVAPLVFSQLFQGLENAVDPTPFLQNPVFVRRQLSCVSGRGPCDFIGRYLQGAVAEVLSRNCRSCTPQQSANAGRVLNFIRTNYPTEYGQIYNRYRPQARTG